MDAAQIAPEAAPARAHHDEPPGAPRVWWWPHAVVVGLSLAVRAWLAQAGNGFQPVQLRGPSVMHLVEPDRLAAHPLAALWDVHTNPPLFNVGVGVLLRWSPLSDAATFRLAFTTGAVVSAVALCQVLRALGCRWWIASVVAALMFTKPAVMAFEYYVAQESLVLPLLYGTLWALARHVRAPSLGRLAAVLGLATALVLTRALFSPLWLLGLVAIVLAVRPPPVAWRRLAVVALLPFLLVGGFMAKNQVRFGTFELSSWMGMNLSRVAILPLGADRTRELIDEGVLSEAAIVGPFRSYDAYEPYVGPCESDHHGTPVLDDPFKDDGTWFENPNFNATCFIPVYDQAWTDAVAAIRHEPRTYARAVGTNVVVYLSDGGDGSTRAGWVGGRLASVLTDIHDLLGLEVSRTATYPHVWTYRYDVVLTFALGLAVVTVAAARAVLRRVRGTATGRDALVLAVAWTALSLTAVSILADAFENARFRAPLDPLVIGIVVAGAAEAVARAVAARRSPAVSPAAG